MHNVKIKLSTPGKKKAIGKNQNISAILAKVLKKNCLPKLNTGHETIKCEKVAIKICYC